MLWPQKHKREHHEKKTKYKIKFIPLMKCKLSQPRESTKMSDIYNFYFDFINKVSLYSKKSDDDDSKEFDPLSWNLSNGGGKKAKKRQQTPRRREN